MAPRHEPPTATVEAERRSRTVPALLFATMFPQAAVSMMSLSPPILVGGVAASYGMPSEAAGIYTGLVYGFVLLGNLLSAPLIDRIGPLRLSFACVLGAACGLVLFGFGGVPGLLAGSVLVGLFYGPLTPASAQAISHQAGSSSFILIVSIRQTAVPMGGMLAGFFVPMLLLRTDWRGTCVVVALVNAAIALLFALASGLVRRERPVRRGEARRSVLAPLGLVWSSRALFRASCASAIFGAGQLILSSFLVVYLVDVVGHDLVTAGALLGASQIAGIAGRPGWGWVADRCGSPRLVLTGLGFGIAVCFLGVIALASVGPSWLSLTVALAAGVTATGWNGVFLAELMSEVAPSEAGSATSGGLLFTYSGIVIGPPLFGALAHVAGFRPAFAAVAGLALFAAFLLWSTDRRRALPSA